jgi:predicted ATPase/DNA-binding SARP family transcriptional activator
VGLKLFLLGQFNIQADETPLDLPSRPAQSLLAYLALNSGVSQRRERLAGLLWPDASESNARSYLRQALWRIRKSFESASVNCDKYLRISDISVLMEEQADVWLDAMLLQQRVDSTEELIGVVELYQGELLPGFYDEWVLVERDRLHSVYHQRMNRLVADLAGLERWDDVIFWAEEWIRLGYSPEPAYRALMRAYAASGDQGMVSAVYQRCRDSMDRDLGLDPSPETRELYDQILLGSWTAASPPADLEETAASQPSFLREEDSAEHERTTFVARSKELRQLDSYLHMILEGNGRAAFVTGEAGSGKTALIQEFSRLAQESHENLVIVGGTCNAHTGIGDPYLPFREILELLTGDVEARWSAGTIGREHAIRLWSTFPQTVKALLDSGSGLLDTMISSSALVDRARHAAPQGAAWLSRLEKRIERRAGKSQASGLHQGDLFEQYSRVLISLSRSVPLVLVVDDLQWADLGSISLLFHLGRQIKGSRILLVCAYRPEEIALGRDGERHPLAPVVNEFLREYGESIVNVDESDSRAFVEDLLDSEPNNLNKAFRSMFFMLTRGNPLFSLELLRGMQDRGDLVQDDNGRWSEGAALDWETLPARVEAVIGERIDRLDPRLRAVLRVASIEGDEFTAEAAARVLSTNEREMLVTLSRELDRRHRLIRSQSILRLDGQLLSRYRFRHTLFQKYLYNSMDDIERVYLHEQVGRTLETLYHVHEESPINTDLAPKLAWHFQEARIIDKAVDYLMKAGRRALTMSAYQEAINLLSDALDLLSNLPHSTGRDNQEALLQLDFAIAWQGIEGSRYPTARQAYTRAYELSQRSGMTRQLSQVLGEMVEFEYVGAYYASARELSVQALELALESGDSVLEALANWYLGYINFAEGKFNAAHEHSSRVISLYDPDRHHDEFVQLRGKDAGMSAMAYDACSLWCLGYPDQARELSQQALVLARELDQPFSRMDVLSFGGCLLAEMSRNAELMKINAQEMIHLSNNIVPGWRGTGEMYLGEALVMLGQVREGIQQIRKSQMLRDTVDTSCYYTGPLLTLAKAEGQAGSPEEGLKMIQRAHEIVERTGERYCEAELFRAWGDLCLIQRDGKQADEYFVKAIEIARQQNAKSWELRASRSLAQLYREQGRFDEALNTLEPIYSWFSEGFNTVDLIEAEELLEILRKDCGQS